MTTDQAMREDRAMRIWDAELLRIAAGILQRRSKRPKSFAVTILVKVLLNAADRIQAGK